MITNDPHRFKYKVRLDDNTVLYINDQLREGNIVCRAEFCQHECESREFKTVSMLFAHYHVNNCDLQDYILRTISFIDGKL